MVFAAASFCEPTSYLQQQIDAIAGEKRQTDPDFREEECRLSPHAQRTTAAACLDVQSRHLLEWVEDESLSLRGPGLADEFVRGESFECLEAASEVVGFDEVVEMAIELPMVVVVIALDGRLRSDRL